MWWSFNAVLDRDVPCGSVGCCYKIQPDGTWVPQDSAARAKNCTGTIPAGQPHYSDRKGWAAEFTVTLVSVGENRIEVMRAVREIAGIPLKDAKIFVDSVPKKLRSSTTEESAKAIEKWIVEAGGTVTIESDDNFRRFCRFCVREMNDRSDDKEPLLVRVELTYSDGTVRYLEDDAAEDWGHVVNSQATMAWAHGCVSNPLPWKQK